MTSVTRKIIVSFLFLSIIPVLKSQEDSLKTEARIARIAELVEEYNSNTIFFDTSDYVSGYRDAKDINIQIAASKGNVSEIVRLFTRGANVNTGSNATPLLYAIASGSTPAVEVLLLLSAQTEVYDIYGNTPLISAVRSNNLDISELLIRHGASLTKTDKQSSTPLHYASANGYFYLADMLLYYDAPTDVVDIEGNTPLMTAVWSDNYEITDILLANGANPNIGDKKGFTPFMLAAQKGDTLMLRMLLDAGANMYALNNDGYDALGIATAENRKTAIDFLLSNGNLWFNNTSRDKSPASVAISCGHRELVPLYRKRGIAVSNAFSLDDISLSAGGMTATHYSLMTAAISLRDPFHKTGIEIGTEFNPARTRLLVKYDDRNIFQYRVRTTILRAGIFKTFNMDKSLAGGSLGFNPSLSLGYLFYSEYSGTRIQPKSKLILIPAIEAEWSKKHFGMRAGIKYLNTPFYLVSPVWINLGASYYINKDNSRTPGKKIRLYSNE